MTCPSAATCTAWTALAQLATELPARLRRGARVLKQYRGHSGIGVWRVERAENEGPSPMMTLRHAQRGSDEEVVDLPTLLQRMTPYFEPAQGGHMIDQAWQPRLAEGMVRAYLVEDRVTGFGHQAVNALVPARPGEPAPQPGPRLYHGPDMPDFQALKQTARVELGRAAAPARRRGARASAAAVGLRLHARRTRAGQPERYVLCEVNVSSVSPFPPSSIGPLVAATKAHLARH